MAFVVKRPRDRWEIRESILTPDGPRARTLASFTELSDEVLTRAESKAHARFVRSDVIRAARRAQVPIQRSSADALAEDLLRALVRGDAPRAGLQRLLRDRLVAADETPAVDEGLAEWIGVTMDERGAALVDLLGLVDRLPARPVDDLTFPGLSPERLRA